LGRRPTVTHHFPFRPLPGHGNRLAAARPAPESTVARTARQPLFTSDAHTRASRAGQPPAGLLLLIQPRRLTRDARGARSQAIGAARRTTRAVDLRPPSRVKGAQRGLLLLWTQQQQQCMVVAWIYARPCSRA
jgi:hypothetical protein